MKMTKAEKRLKGAAHYLSELSKDPDVPKNIKKTIGKHMNKLIEMAEIAILQLNYGTGNPKENQW
jgi:uncharacterized protein (UPF0147 family)